MLRARIPVVLVLLVIAASVAGCLASYTFDFIDEGDLVNEQGAWFADGPTHSFTGQGLWMADYMVTAPYGYSGNFKCTFEFYVNYGTDPVEWMSFLLIDDKWQDGVSVAKFFGLTIHNYSSSFALASPAYTGPEYSVWQGSDFDYFNKNAEPPGMVNNAINVVEISKRGEYFTVRMNGTVLGSTMLIKPANRTAFWYPGVSGSFGYPAPHGFFLRRVTVSYWPGTELEASWAF